MTSGGDTAPTEAIKPPTIGGNYELDESILTGKCRRFSGFCE